MANKRENLNCGAVTRLIKFIYSEMATKFCEIFTLLLSELYSSFYNQIDQPILNQKSLP